MIEKVVLDYLTGKLGIPVFLEMPVDVPPVFIIIEKTGGSMEDKIFSATFAVQSIAATLYQAAELNERVLTAMLDIVELDDIFASHLNSNYNFTDPDTKLYRYQAVFNLVY